MSDHTWVRLFWLHVILLAKRDVKTTYFHRLVGGFSEWLVDYFWLCFLSDNGIQLTDLFSSQVHVLDRLGGGAKNREGGNGWHQSTNHRTQSNLLAQRTDHRPRGAEALLGRRQAQLHPQGQLGRNGSVSSLILSLLFSIHCSPFTIRFEAELYGVCGPIQTLPARRPCSGPPHHFRPLLTWDDLRAIYHCNPILLGIMGMIWAPKPKGYISFCVCRILNFNKERYVGPSAMLIFALLVDLPESYGLTRPVVQQTSLKEEADLQYIWRPEYHRDVYDFINDKW